MLVALKCSQSPDVESFLVTAHGVLYKLWCHHANWCSHHTPKSTALKTIKTVLALFVPISTLNQVAVVLRSFIVKTSSRLLIRTFIDVGIQGKQSHLGSHSFVESHSGSEGKSCARKAIVLDPWTCTYTQNKKLLHEDYLTRPFDIHVQGRKAKKQAKKESLTNGLLLSDILMSLRKINQLQNGILTCFAVTMSPFLEWLQKYS